MSKDTKHLVSTTNCEEKNSFPALFDLAPVDKKPVDLTFTGNKISTDGGLLLLREIENQIGLLGAISDCIADARHQGYVKHSVKSLLTQRVFQIAAGYEDANDCNTLRDDKILKLCTGRLPDSGHDLSSQPTMSRFENSISPRQLYNIALAFINQFIGSYDEPPKVIILDCDDTNSNTHGAQQLSLFNQYYGEYCYMPLHIYEGLSGKLISTILRPGSRSKTADVFAILSRIINHLRKVWKDTIIIVRGDAHFCSKELMSWTKDKPGVRFITGLTPNASLNKMTNQIVEQAKALYEHSGKPVKRFHSFQYAAQSWDAPQRVIVKVEVNDRGVNIRYIVTDIEAGQPGYVYNKLYCARGKMELYIKDNKTYLHSDRMSCNDFHANQFRLFMHSAAYVLLHTLRSEILRLTEFARATMQTIQLRLIKVAAIVKEMKTRIKVEFPKQFPSLDVIANSLCMFKILRC